MKENLAALLVDKEKELSMQRSWNLGYDGNECLGHIAPSLSCDLGDQKIRVLFRADLNRHQAQEIAEHLIGVAEKMEEFAKPAHVYQRKLPGRHWTFNRIGDLAQGRRYCFINALHKDGQDWGIRFTVDADVTPHQAREVGSYLLGMAAQISG